MLMLGRTKKSHRLRKTPVSGGGIAECAGTSKMSTGWVQGRRAGGERARVWDTQRHRKEGDRTSNEGVKCQDECGCGAREDARVYKMKARG
jgi:hypothetical protein